MKKGLLILIFLLCALPVAAMQGSTKLVALGTNSSGSFGTIAKLELQIKPGNERVFVETVPLTQITTQASLRFAQQMACDELDIDCSNYDFFWTIHAVPGMVGGPSAGASAALLVSSLLLDKPLSDKVAVTGLINSGGSIGPVGSIKKKIEAAANNGIDTLFVAKDILITVNESNISAEEYGDYLNVNVVEIGDLNTLLNLTLGVPLKQGGDFVLGGPYEDIMRRISDDLCRRTEDLLQSNYSLNLTSRAAKAVENGSFYSAASFCFRANVEKRVNSLQNSSKADLDSMKARLGEEAFAAKQITKEVPIETLSDVQTYMAVMERIDDAKELLDIYNESNSSFETIAYAQERLYSAFAWSQFFGHGVQSFELHNGSLKAACMEKISEAQERSSYLITVLTDNKGVAVSKDLKNAEKALKSGDYIMCLYSAAKAKSESNLLMNLIGISDRQLNQTVDLKLSLASRSVARSLDKGVFPLLAYSYLEYANSLRAKEPMSAMLFAEYALELSNLEIYFKGSPSHRKYGSDFVGGVAVGFVAGVILTFLAVVSYKTLQTPRRRLRGKKR